MINSKNTPPKFFERLTNNARNVLVHSYELALKDKDNRDNEITPKHLFLAILLDKGNLAARLLEKLSVDLNKTAQALLTEGTVIINGDVQEVQLDGEAAKNYKHTHQRNYSAGGLQPSDEFKRIIGEAFFEASQLGHVYVGCEHFLLSLMRSTGWQFVKDLENAGLGYEKLRSELISFGSYQPGVFADPNASNYGKTGPKSAKGTPGQLEDMPMPNGIPMPGPQNQSMTLGLPNVAQGDMSGDDSSSALDFFGRKMNDLAKEGKFLPTLGREEEISRMIHILSRQTKNNPILIGEAGVGKTAIVEGLVHKIVSGKVPKSLKSMEIIQIDIAGIIAGAKIRGDVEERLLAIMNEVQDSDNKVIFIDEIHTIVGAGAQGPGGDVANVIKPYLTSGDMRVIGATTNSEYRRYFEDDGALARRFQPVNVDELDEESTLKVLEFLRPNFQNYHRVTITDEALEEAVKLSARYVTDRRLPDKAIDLIDEAAAKQKIRRDKSSKREEKLEGQISEIQDKKEQALVTGNLDLAGEIRIIEQRIASELKDQLKKQMKVSKRHKVVPEDIREIVSDWTKIPVGTMSATDLRLVAQLQKTLAGEIIGQGDALVRVAAALKRAKLGLNDMDRPMASFLFLGPTGVGKTETAKVIAKELFGKESALIQVNMSEMMEAHSVSKIIGAPPGYVGYQDGSNITEQIRQNPYSVVLFDEIEKAHPDLLNIMLQILDEGYVQDSKGRKVSFKNAVVIMTSNIGADSIADDQVLGFSVDLGGDGEEKLEQAYDEMREKVMSELKDYLKPELINRIDEVIVYRGLNEDDMTEIAKLRLADLNQRLGEKHLGVDVSKKLLDKIAEDGYSKEYGARNINRKIQEMIETSLADYLLENSLVPELEKRKQKKSSLLKLKAELVAEDNSVAYKVKRK